MSRGITAGFNAEIISDTVKPFLLFQAFFDTGTIRFWSGVGDLLHDGDIYTGAGHLLKLNEIEETTRIEAKGINLILSGVPSSLIAVALSEKYQQRRVTVDLGFFDTSDVIVVDPFRFFSGKADIMAITDGAGHATISLTAESDMIILQKINERRRTNEDQKIELSSDTFFSEVTSLLSKSVVWGGS